MSRRPRIGLDTVSCAIPVAALVAFGIGLLATLPSLLSAVYANSDVAMAPYVTELWLKAPAGSQLLMGHAPFYVGLWIFRLLHLFPDYRLTWELAPWLLSVAASLAVGWAVFRAAGRAAALLACATLICAGTYLLQLQFAWSIHGLAYVNVMLLGTFLVWLSRERTDSFLLWPMALVLASVTAAGVATDKLLIVAGLVPFAVTGIPMALRGLRAGRAHVAGAVGVVAAGSVGGAFIVQAAMRSEHLRSTAFPVHITALRSVPSNLLLLIQGVFSLLNGYLHESAAAQTSPRGPLGYLSAAAVVFLIALAVIEVAELLRRIDADDAGAHRLSRSGTFAARYVNTGFWCANAALLAVVYVGTTLPHTISTRRYLVTVAYAIVVLGISRGLSAGRRTRILTVAAVTTLLATSIVGLLERNLSKIETSGRAVAIARGLDRLIAREHVAVAYAGYWDSYALGWLGSRFVQIEPVFTYRHRLFAGVGSGAGYGGVISPQPVLGKRSLLLLDTVLDGQDGMTGVPLGDLGAPLAAVTFDHGRVRAYVYDYDIGKRIQRVTS